MKKLIIILLGILATAGKPTYNTHASYYGPGLFGNKMANGKVLTKNTIAVAHRKYPFGTKLLITNLLNNKKIVVTVQDRGPFVDKNKRTLDISYAAAVQLDMIDSGIIPVKVEII